MRIKPISRRTQSDPTEGVVFTVAEQKEITEYGSAMLSLPERMIRVIRSALAREIMFMEELGDWVSPDSQDEERQQARLKDALLTYQATYAAATMKRMSHDTCVRPHSA